MTFYKELILGLRPAAYKQKYVIQGLDANERVYLSNRLKAQNIDSEVWNGYDNVYRGLREFERSAHNHPVYAGCGSIKV